MADRSRLSPPERRVTGDDNSMTGVQTFTESWLHYPLVNRKNRMFVFLLPLDSMSVHHLHKTPASTQISPLHQTSPVFCLHNFGVLPSQSARGFQRVQGLMCLLAQLLQEPPLALLQEKLEGVSGQRDNQVFQWERLLLSGGLKMRLQLLGFQEMKVAEGNRQPTVRQR